MISLANINNSFEKNKNIIIDLLIDYYGQEYSELIKNRLNDVYFDFSSTPEEDYKYLKKHGNQLDGLSKILIKLRYVEYKKVQKDSKKIYNKLLIEYIKDELLKSDFDEINIDDEIFLSLFTDENFNRGYIDSFSSKSNSLLIDFSIPESIKESILNDQKYFISIINSLGIKIENLTASDVDYLIEYRKVLQNKYKELIIQNSRYGKNLFKALKNRFSIKSTPEVLSYIAFLENAWAGYIYMNNSTFYQIMKVPLLYLMNIGLKGLDVNIIHEMIHKVETNGIYVGISVHDDEDTNNIINEIRTQDLAIKITKKLQELGIYVYDNPDDCKIKGESNYEDLFPLTKEFIDKYERVLSDCAINNELNKLCEYFGESWKEFSDKINNLYYRNRQYSLSCIHVNDEITQLISSMESFRKGSVRSV